MTDKTRPTLFFALQETKSKKRKKTDLIPDLEIRVLSWFPYA